MVTLLPENAISCSSEVRALRMPPSARWATSSSASPSKVAPSATQMAPSRATISSVEMRRKSKRWQREWMVSGTFCGSVVHRMNTTWEGGSSSVFNSALKAAVESMCTSSMMYTFERPRVGAYCTREMISSRTFSTPVREAASSSYTSGWVPLAISRHSSQVPSGSGVGPFSHSSALAKSRAVVVLPVPRGPVNR